MFSDPFSAVMALILLAFVGTVAIFFRVWRELDALRASMRDMQDSIQMNAVDVAQQNRDIAAVLRELRSLNAEKSGESVADKNLGDLLERGLPNLTEGGMSGLLEEPYSGLQTPAHEPDADLFRHLGADPFDKKP